MGRAPKTKVTADAGAQAPAEAKTAAPILSEGDAASAGAGISPVSSESDAATSEAETAPEMAQASVTEDPQSDPPPPDDSGADVLALVISPVLHDGAMLQIDATPLLSPADFAKLATAGAVIRAEID